jgi:hypothetical protein
MIGNICYWLHKNFVKQYLPHLHDAIMTYFKEAPDVEIRKIQKEKYDKTIKHLGNISRRVYTYWNSFNSLDHFDLSMSTKFLKSNYLQRRIEGIKTLNDVCKNTQKPQLFKITTDELAEYLIKNNILDCILGTQVHQQIVQRSGPVLNFLYERKQLKLKDIETLLALTKDEQLRADVFKVICEIGLPAESPDLEYIASKIATMNPTDICEEALDVFNEAKKNVNKATDQLLKYAEIMSSIAFNKNFPPGISEKALVRYSEMISTLDFDPHKKKVIQQCLNLMIEKVRLLLYMNRMIIQF